MSDPAPQTIGSFTIGVAKLAEHGDLTYEGDSPNGFSDVYYVVMADTATRPTTANVSGLPSYGAAADSTDTSVRSLRVSKIVFSQLARDSRVWKVTVTYELKSGGAGSGEEEEEEDDGRRNLKVSFGVAEDSADVTTDVETGRLIVNSAGDPFDSVPQKRTFGAEIRIEFDTDVFPLADYLSNGHVNSTSFSIGGLAFARHSLMLRVEVTDSDDMAHRWHCVYTLTQKINNVAKPDNYSGDVTELSLDIGWDVAFAECGFQYLDGSGNKVKFAIEDENKQLREPSLPMPLDSDGHPSDTPSVRIVAVYPEMDFSHLSIPSVDTGSTTATTGT